MHYATSQLASVDTVTHLLFVMIKMTSTGSHCPGSIFGGLLNAMDSTTWNLCLWARKANISACLSKSFNPNQFLACSGMLQLVFSSPQIPVETSRGYSSAATPQRSEFLVGLHNGYAITCRKQNTKSLKLGGHTARTMRLGFVLGRDSG